MGRKESNQTNKNLPNYGITIINDCIIGSHLLINIQDLKDDSQHNFLCILKLRADDEILKFTFSYQTSLAISCELSQ